MALSKQNLKTCGYLLDSCVTHGPDSFIVDWLITLEEIQQTIVFITQYLTAYNTHKK